MKFESSVPNVPGVTINPGPVPGPEPIIGVLPPAKTITYDGNIAVTAINGQIGSQGAFHLSDIGVFAKNVSNGGGIPDGVPTGVVCAGGADTSNGGCIGGISNSTFNNPLYPNPIGDPTPTDFNSLPSNTHLAPGNGVTGDHDFSLLRTALDVALDGNGSFPAFAC